MTNKKSKCKAGEKQIPYGNDNKKGKCKSDSETRIPSGMTNKKGKCKGNAPKA